MKIRITINTSSIDFDSAEDAADAIIEFLEESDEGAGLYRDYLHDCYPEGYYVETIRFEAADILEELDPIAFRCGMSDYLDSLRDDYIAELGALGPGRAGIDFNGWLHAEIAEADDVKEAV